jgi:hypothetical protein
MSSDPVLSCTRNDQPVYVCPPYVPGWERMALITALELSVTNVPEAFPSIVAMLSAKAVAAKETTAEVKHKLKRCFFIAIMVVLWLSQSVGFSTECTVILGQCLVQKSRRIVAVAQL